MGRDHSAQALGCRARSTHLVDDLSDLPADEAHFVALQDLNIYFDLIFFELDDITRII